MAGTDRRREEIRRAQEHWLSMGGYGAVPDHLIGGLGGMAGNYGESDGGYTVEVAKRYVADKEENHLITLIGHALSAFDINTPAADAAKMAVDRAEKALDLVKQREKRHYHGLRLRQPKRHRQRRRIATAHA